MMSRKVIAEALGSCFLLMAVVGSGIMGEALSGGNMAVALLANALATGCALYVLITVLGPVSGAHFNPAVTLYFRATRQVTTGMTLAYILAQVVGGIIGVWLAHGMFDLAILQISATPRTGASQWLAEAVATFGLLFAIVGGVRHASAQIPALVAAYITGAYWFTASTSFANPAVTIARSWTDTFAGIAPQNIIGFILAQLVSVALAVIVLPRILPEK